jgi:hypothetical protein
MLSLRFTGVQNALGGLKSEIRSEVKRLADVVYAEVKQRTPVDTGRAKAGWNKNVSDTEFVVSNAVPYIEVLDKGRHMTNRGIRGSKQAPKGIVGPSLESIKRKN